MSKTMIVKSTGEACTVIETKSGWVSVKMADPKGATKKFRAKDLEDAPKAAKAPKGEGAPVRQARPAHFVSETAGDVKIAKIKGTEFNLSRYFVGDTRTESGRRTIDCADETAANLRGMPLNEVYGHVAEKLGETVKSLQAKYEHLNPGMQRMNLGNRLRGALAAAAKEAAKAE